MARTERSGHTTTDHDFIRRWVEERSGWPARVAGTGGGEDPGILRIDFPGYSGGDSLERMEWEEWFEKFDENDLAFLHRDMSHGGDDLDRFNKLVSRSGNEDGGGGSRGRASSSSSRGGSSSRSTSSRSGGSSSRASSSGSKSGGSKSSSKSGGSTSRGSSSKSSGSSSSKSSGGTSRSTASKSSGGTSRSSSGKSSGSSSRSTASKSAGSTASKSSGRSSSKSGGTSGGGSAKSSRSGGSTSRGSGSRAETASSRGGSKSNGSSGGLIAAVASSLRGGRSGGNGGGGGAEEMRELLKHELGDLLFAEKVFLKGTRTLAKEAQDPTVKERLEAHVEETQGQIERLQEAFRTIGEKPKAEKCEAALGLQEEHDSFKSEEKPSKMLLSAFDLGSGLRVEHYEIAGYRSAIAVATAMGEKECVALLKENLQEEMAMASFLEKNSLAVLKSMARA